MADNKKPNEGDAPAPDPANKDPANKDQQTVVSRVSNLPLVSSACEAVSSAYSTTKETVPLLKGVMDVAESGVRTLGAAASTGSKPLLDMMEPQLATVNEYAMKGLDKVEEKLPILHQPADKVVSDTVGKVYQSVAGAKEAMVGAMMGGITTVMGTRMGQMVSSGMGLALSRSEDWVDQNLPLTERELAAVAEPVTDDMATSSGSSPSYFVRLSKLSSKVQDRALQHSLDRVRHYRDAAHAAMGQITSTLDLLEAARAGLGSASSQMGDASEKLLQRLTEWKQIQGGNEETESEPDPDGTKAESESQQLETHTLSMLHGLSYQLRSACYSVVSSIKGLPSAIQDQLTVARLSAEELCSSLGSTDTITPVLLEQSRYKLIQVQRSLDGVVDYLLNHTPLNWLVGPFTAQITEHAEGDAAAKAGPKK